jgi:hypothetical protein
MSEIPQPGALFGIEHIGLLDPDLAEALSHYDDAHRIPRHPGDAFGECYDVAQQLAYWLRGYGYRARVSRLPGDTSPGPDTLGMSDRLNMGAPRHHWTIASRGQRMSRSHCWRSCTEAARNEPRSRARTR